jgi:hypothetical protein
VTLLRTILALMIFVILAHLGLVYSEVNENLNGLTQAIYGLARLLEIPAEAVLGALPTSAEQRETIQANNVYSIGFAAIAIYFILFWLLGVGRG